MKISRVHPALVLTVATVAASSEMYICSEICISTFHGAQVYYVDVVCLVSIFLIYLVLLVMYVVAMMNAGKKK